MSSESANSSYTLRVLYVIDSRFPAIGGAESQALKLAVALRNKGVHVDFLTPQIVLDQPLKENHLGFDIQRFSYPHIKYLGTIFMMINFARCLFAKRRQYDCIHVHIASYLSATAGLVRPYVKTPVMTKISGFFEFEGGILDMRGGFHPINWFLRKSMGNIDYVHTISHQTRDKLITAGFREDQIRFIPNGVDTQIEPIDPPDQEKLIVGYCGRLRYVKGVHVLIEAIALLGQQLVHQNLELHIAGDGDTMDELKEQVRRLDMEENVVFLGAVTDTESFYASLDIYVQPSFSEGLPNSVIEAMNAARPVIASNIGGNQDLVIEGETGYLFAAGDSEQLKDKLAMMISQSSKRLAMGRSGRERIKAHFDIDGVVEQLVELYSEK